MSNRVPSPGLLCKIGGHVLFQIKNLKSEESSSYYPLRPDTFINVEEGWYCSIDRVNIFCLSFYYYQYFYYYYMKLLLLVHSLP